MGLHQDPPGSRASLCNAIPASVSLTGQREPWPPTVLPTMFLSPLRAAVHDCSMDTHASADGS